MDIAKMKARADALRPRLDELRRAMKARLAACSPNAMEGGKTLREAFDLMVDADNNADALKEATGLAWGFGPYDARFLHSLRDQQAGVGCAQRDLTRQQLSVMRNVLMSEAYLTQITLLLSE